MEDQPQSRFHVVAAPAQQPAEDFFTRSTVGPFIDTMLTIDLHRFTLAQVKNGMRVYVNRDTIREWAEQLGLFDESEEEKKHYEIGYSEGYSDALKENLGGDLRNISDRLGLVADWLGDMAAMDADEESAEILASATAIDE